MNPPSWQDWHSAAGRALVDPRGLVHVWDGRNDRLYAERWTLCERRGTHEQARFAPLSLTFVNGNFAITCLECLVHETRRQVP